MYLVIFTIKQMIVIYALKVMTEMSMKAYYYVHVVDPIPSTYLVPHIPLGIPEQVSTEHCLVWTSNK